MSFPGTFKKAISCCGFSMSAVAALVVPTLGATRTATAATPTSSLEYSAIVGEGTTISITRLPIRKSTGATIYKDVTVEFTVEADGTLTLDSLTQDPSPALKAAKFQPGKYFVQQGAKVVIGTLAGGTPGSGGSTLWTLTLPSSPSQSVAPLQSSWQTGSPPPDLATRITNAGLTIDPAESYGTAAQGTWNTPFYGNPLIAAEQVAGTLRIVSYSYCCNSTATNTPQGSVVLTRCVDSACSNAPK